MSGWALAGLVDLEKEWPIQYHAIAHDMGSRGSDRAYHDAALIAESDRTPVDVMLRRTAAMLDDYARFENVDLDLAACREELARLKKQAAGLDDLAKYKVPSLRYGGVGKKERHTKEPPNEAGTMDMGDARDVFIAACKLNRKVALANPLLRRIDRLVFVKKHPPRVGHMCDQWFGMAQDPGGGLFVLDKPGRSEASLTDLTAGAKVVSGPMKGKTLHEGVFASPAVSYDGEKVWFAYSRSTRAFSERWEQAMVRAEKDPKYRNAPWGGTMWHEEYFRTAEDAFNLFVINADGTGLEHVTSGAEDDHSPCVLPNGRIAFVSTRRGGEGRCHPRPCPTYVLHTMLPDGSDIQPLSYHEINEWTPRVNNDGRVVYSRWDYVDRSFSDGQHPWITTPDGRDARDLYGNYESAFRGKVQEDLRAVPDSPFYVGVMHTHHQSAYGRLVMYDSREPDTKPQPGITFLTPITQHSNYASPYPLDETYFLCVWSPDSPNLSLNTWRWHRPPTPHGVYLIDKFGNRTLLYRDDEIPAMCPVPLQARPKPPVLPHLVAHAYPRGAAKSKADPDKATFAVIDVYNSRMPWPEDRKIKSLRIFQVFPKSTPRKGNPAISYNVEVNSRGLIGEVPVESDGSAHFEIPSRVPVYLQAVDENGLAIQSMRTSFYGMPGEHNTCLGCHDQRRKAPSPVADTNAAMALRRPPSKPTPGPEGSWPMTFSVLVQPVLEAKCVKCHSEHDKAPKFKSPRGSYRELKEWAWALNAQGNIMTRPKGKHEPTSRVRSIPNKVGAYASRLYPLLTTGSHKDKVKLTDEEMRRIVLWLDGFSCFYGAYEDTGAQQEGKIVIPSLQ
jgi:hypothetical protein